MNKIKDIARLLPLLLLLITQAAWGQDDLSGLYYIQSNNTTTNYLYPHTSNFATGKPYVRTQNNRSEDAVWKLEHQEGNYYKIQHYKDKTYMIARPDQTSNSAYLSSVEEDITSDNALFEIVLANGHITMKAKNANNSGSKNYIFHNSTNTVALGASSDNKAKWNLVDIPANPSFSRSDTYITMSNSLGNIYYNMTIGADGADPTSSSTKYTGAFRIQYGPKYYLRMIAIYKDKEDVEHLSEIITNNFQINVAKPQIEYTYDAGTGKYLFSIKNNQPGVMFRYTANGSTPSATTGTIYEGPFAVDAGNITVKAIAYNVVEETTYASGVTTQSFSLGGATTVHSFDDIDDLFGTYILASDFTSTGTPVATTADAPFKGFIDGQFCEISLSQPLFDYVENATIRNITVSNVNITTGTNVGAIAGTAKGATRIYNCGILAGDISGSGDIGGIVGLLDGTSRVINCYSYANISGGNNAAGIVGNNTKETKLTNIMTMVMNCMFYGNITNATTMKPVYGGKVISNAGVTGVNGYNYYRNGDDVTFDNGYTKIGDYNYTWPAEEDYLTRYEYYRSILNSNRKLCVWWLTGRTATEQTADDDKMMAKWVLDSEKAPYPILKPWGKYSSIINPDQEYTWNPKTHQKVSRTSAPDYQGKHLGAVSITVNAGTYHQGTGSTQKGIDRFVLDMDTLNHDYGYAKIQLPYYNEVFGNPEASDHANRYAGNYTDHVVTGWKVIAIEDADDFEGTRNAFDGSSDKAWESGFNFADRNCTDKDLYSVSKRVFAQGGYFYVPEKVKSIIIEAYWGTAVYLHNKEHSLDRVNVASGGQGTGAEFGTPFSPAGSLATSYKGQTVQTTLQDAINQLKKVSSNSSLTVYDQAVVLIGNVQVKNRGENVGRGKSAPTDNRPFTIMSIDEDMDNEPDYCLELQFRNDTDRPGIHPIRFDFLPIPELGLAMRTNAQAYAIGVMVPQGHFEITETSFMHTTQFEYDADVGKVEAPLILNGGHFEQIVLRYGPKKNTSYILMGGHFFMRRFTPGYHATPRDDAFRHCAVNAIGGDYPEFYLSGIYNPDYNKVNTDNPHCYVNGGRFGIMAGAGYEQVKGSVTFKIDHAIIDEFYGGGINGAKPITGDIDVTINNSIVHDIYCGGPKVGSMTKTNGVRKTVTTNAYNTVFGKFFGGGDGGTSYYREQKYDNDADWPSNWYADTYFFPSFNPLNTVDGKTKQYDTNKGYHDLFEFEVFNQSNGLNTKAVVRTFIHWAQFGTTTTGNVVNNLTKCIVKKDFFGGGNLGNVEGTVTSTLTNTHVMGSAYAAGFSASIPQFRMHDVNSVRVPHRNQAGQIDEQGYLDYVKDGGKDRYYRWTNDNNGGSASTDNPTYYSTEDGEWKCYTPISLAGLGEVSGNATITINGTTEIDEDVYGGGAEANIGGDTQVNLIGGTVTGDVYGGGKGRLAADAVGTEGQSGYKPAVTAVAATVGATTVNLNKDLADDAVGCVVKGEIFGCNNLNGTPKGDVTVNIYRTQGYEGHRRTGIDAETAAERQAALDNIDDAQHSYELKAVYGGGNLAAYEPDAPANKHTQVNIYGCGDTSIRQVYGGGNAASTPATQIDIYGTYEIEEVFGGGNGKDDISLDGVNYIANPGANVGFHAYTDDQDDTDTPEKRASNYGYGSGQAKVNINGGRIHRVYGGSNTKGNVREIAVTMLEETGGCDFVVDEAYGGGKSASMDGQSKLEMACIPGLKNAYGGAENANINNDVTLNITNGNFNRVFGGNNVSGTINGTITVNIEETGCHHITIGQLYGGGNQAPYTGPLKSGSNTERQGPTLNVRSFSSIGEVYGGGYGKTATVTGDTYVNINVCDGKDFGANQTTELARTNTFTGNKTISFAEFRRTDDGGFALDNQNNRIIDYRTLELYLPPFTSGIGGINNVYGGGNAAKVIGNTHVNIGTTTGESVVFITPTSESLDANRTHTVKGANIVGNIYGGGNAAEVTGKTKVQIGKKVE